MENELVSLSVPAAKALISRSIEQAAPEDREKIMAAINQAMSKHQIAKFSAQLKFSLKRAFDAGN